MFHDVFSNLRLFVRHTSSKCHTRGGEMVVFVVIDEKNGEECVLPEQ